MATKTNGNGNGTGAAAGELAELEKQHAALRGELQRLEGQKLDARDLDKATAHYALETGARAGGGSDRGTCNARVSAPMTRRGRNGTRNAKRTAPRRAPDFEQVHQNVVEALQDLAPALAEWTQAFVSGVDRGNGEIGHIRRVYAEIQSLARDREIFERAKAARAVDAKIQAEKGDRVERARREAEAESARVIAFEQAKFDTVRPQPQAGPWA